MNPSGTRPSSNQSGRPRRREVVLLCLIFAAGTVLRCADPARSAIEHFDEGVYASNLVFPDTGRYPYRHLYAPPLVPAMIEWSIVLFGPTIGSLLPGMLFGSLTVPLVWWIGRRWFSPAAGLAAATLAACSDVHALYSRTALTDVPLTFWLLAAVALFRESCLSGSFRLAVAAGAAAAAAWWTKYNGWLPLVIGLAGMVLWLMARRTNASAASRRAIAVWIVTALVAAAAWSPVLIGLDAYGGYATVAANHRGYLHGLDGWWPALVRQAQNHSYLEGVLTASGFVLAAALAAGVQRTSRPLWGGAAASIAAGLMFSGLSLWLSSAVVLAVLAMLGVAVAACDRSSERLAVCFLAAWFVGLFLATPFYHAYPRLTLPWLAATWLGAGLAIDRLTETLTATGSSSDAIRGSSATATGSSHVWQRRLSLAGLLGAAAAALALFAIALPGRLDNGVPAWQDRSHFARIAESIVRQLETGSPADGNAAATPSPGSQPTAGSRSLVIAVYAEPALLFHLASGLSETIVAPAADLASVVRTAADPPEPVYLITAIRAGHDSAFESQWTQWSFAFELIEKFPYTPGTIVLLNEFDPARLTRTGRHPVEEVRLYRVRTSASTHLPQSSQAGN